MIRAWLTFRMIYLYLTVITRNVKTLVPPIEDVEAGAAKTLHYFLAFTKRFFAKTAHSFEKMFVTCRLEYCNHILVGITIQACLN